MSPLPKDEYFGPVLIDGRGNKTPLTNDECELVRSALKVIRGGKAVQAQEQERMLSTGEAAELLGVSRRTVARLMDAGEIPFERYGAGHRRVAQSSVLAYKDEAARRHEALEEMRRHMDEGGFYDLDFAEEYLSQFDEGEGE